MNGTANDKFVTVKLGRCAGCSQDRLLRQHGDDWLCSGPNKCYQKRATGRVNRRKPRKGSKR